MKAGTSQRRPGLHVDSPGHVKIKHSQQQQQGFANEGAGNSDKYTGSPSI